MIPIPNGMKLDQVFNGPKHAVDHVQRNRFTGRLDFIFSLKTAHVFWRDGKPVGAILAMKFGPAEYGRGVIDKMPEMIGNVSKIEFYQYSEGDLFNVFIKNPDATLIEKTIEVNQISIFINTTDDKTLKLLKMLLFGKSWMIDAIKPAFGEGFEQSLKNLTNNKVISTDGIKCIVPQHVALIMRNEMIANMLNERNIISALSIKNPALLDLISLMKQGKGMVNIKTINERVQNENLIQATQTFLEKNIMVEGVDEKGEKLYIIPDDVFESISKIQEGITRGEITPEEAASVKGESEKLKASREEMRKKLLEKYKVRELEKGEIQNIVGKFYGGGGQG